MAREAEPAEVLLLAHPAGHSLSPVMHDAAFHAVGLPGRYRAVDVPPAGLELWLRRLTAPPYLGANVTVPHKEAVVPFMHELTPAARAVGAVNTIVRRGGTLVGHNTDAEGFLRALGELGQPDGRGRAPWPQPLTGATSLVLGAGGAARAVVQALATAGSTVHVLNRNAQRAERLVADLAAGSAVRPTDLPSLLPRTDLLVNSTSVGMAGGADPDGVPLLAADELQLLPATAAVVDLVYRPAVTPLLQLARARGLVTQNGLAMLVWQGALAFEEWTGVSAPVAAMRSAAERALGGRG